MPDLLRHLTSNSCACVYNTRVCLGHLPEYDSRGWHMAREVPRSLTPAGSGRIRGALHERPCFSHKAEHEVDCLTPDPYVLANRSSSSAIGDADDGRSNSRCAALKRPLCPCELSAARRRRCGPTQPRRKPTTRRSRRAHRECLTPARGARPLHAQVLITTVAHSSIVVCRRTAWQLSSGMTIFILHLSTASICKRSARRFDPAQR